jgi:hypothetical protein
MVSEDVNEEERRVKQESKCKSCPLDHPRERALQPRIDSPVAMRAGVRDLFRSGTKRT